MAPQNKDVLKAKERAQQNPRRRPHSESCHCTYSDRTPLKPQPPLQEVNGGPEHQDLPPITGPPVPPDGGWGWVVMVASFFVNMLVDGVCFSFGLFYLEFLDYYGASKGKTSWVGSTLNGMYLSMGPIVSALANKFGCRKVTMAGSVLACVAYVLATFSPNVDVLILFWGAMGGAGFGLMYLPAIVMVGFYFEKRRALATGVAVCGSGIGAFAFAPLCEYFISSYGWKGASWILGAIVLNGLVTGALFRPLEPEKVRHSAPNVAVQQKHKLATQEKLALLGDGDTPSAGQNGKLGCVEKSLHLRPDMNIDNGVEFSSMSHLPTHMRNEVSGKNLCRSMDEIALYSKRDEETEKVRLRDLQRPLYRKDIFYSGSISHLAEFQSQKDLDSYHRSITNIPEVTSAEKEGNWCVRTCRSMCTVFRQMMDFSLLKNPVFAVYGASCFLCMLGFFVPFTYLPDIAVGLGISRGKAAFLVSIIGIANTVFRVLSGWVSDQRWADCLLINNIALVVGGVATILCPFCINYGLLGTYSCVFGASIAVFVSLRSIIMVELLGLERLTNSFGLVTLCQGLSSFIGAPIAGSLYDWTGSYDISFYAAGSTLALAGLICFPLRRIARWQDQREKQKLGLVESGVKVHEMQEMKDGHVTVQV